MLRLALAVAVAFGSFAYAADVTKDVDQAGHTLRRKATAAGNDVDGSLRRTGRKARRDVKEGARHAKRKGHEMRKDLDRNVQ